MNELIKIVDEILKNMNEFKYVDMFRYQRALAEAVESARDELRGYYEHHS